MGVISIWVKPREKRFPNHAQYIQYSEEDKERLAESIFKHYKEIGFPYYPTDKLWRYEKFQQLQNTEFITSLEEDNSIRQTMVGLSLAWSYMPHSFKVQCGKMRTPYQAFEEDKIFKKVIQKIIKLGNNTTTSGIRKTLRIYTGTQGVSNFRPTAAACIYHHFDCKGKTVWDMSCGYGGRVLGANLVGVGKYIGTEPCEITYDGLQEMIGDWVTIPTEIHKCGSEDFLPEKESLDLCFTSPPYFNTEKYSDESTQSWVKYSSKEKWINDFLKKTFKNCHFGLKPNGKMIINIANVKTFPNLESETIRVAKEVGFDLKETWKLSLSSMPSDDSKFKYEPIFIFRKVNKYEK